MLKKFLTRLKDHFTENSIPTEDELAARYREMHDTAFKMLDYKELTPLARKCYDAEKAYRHRKARE